MYRQTLMAGLRAAARKLTNLVKVNSVRQEPTESPSAFLERLMEAFRQYTPMDPQTEESRAAVLLAFVNQAAPDIRKKLQKIEGLGEQMIQDLLKAAEKVFNNRETTEEREERLRREERELAEKIRKEDREHRAVLPVVGVPGRERRLLETMQLAIGEFITDSSQGLPPSPRV